MRRSQLKNQIRQVFLEKGFVPIKEIPVHKCDFAVRSPKFALNGFFKLYDMGKELVAHWIEAQDEVRESLELHSEILNRHNTYLVFMLPVEELPPITDVQPIISDEYVCRKLIASIEDTDFRKSLRRLPFYPFDVPELPTEVLPKNVKEALASSVFPHGLISDLAGRVSEGTISRKLKEGLYGHDEVERRMVEEVTLPELDSVHRTRIQNIFIRNFRGIGKKLELDTDANLVVIYGPNGTGKTSILDALEWTITGEVERLGGRNYDKPLDASESLVNLFSKDRVAEARICFARNGESVLERRYLDLSKARRSFAEIDGRRVTDKTMIKEVVGIRMPQVDVRRLRRVFLRSHFLGQNTILDFITQDPGSRYDAFSHMVGTQDYVLFTEKTNSVIRILERDIVTKAQPKKELDEEIKKIALEIERKQRSFEKLKKGIREESSTQAIIKEIQGLIKDLCIKVPGILIPSKEGQPGIEELDKLSEIVSTHSDTSSNRITLLANLLAESRHEKRREQDTQKTATSLETLTKNISELQRLLTGKESALSGLQKKLKEHTSQKENYEKQIVNIKWLIDVLPQYNRTQQRLACVRKKIQELSKEKSSTQEKVKVYTEQLSRLTTGIDKSQKEDEDVRQTLNSLLELRKHLHSWTERLEGISQIGKSLQELNKETAQLQKKKTDLEKEIEFTTRNLESIESNLDAEKEKKNRKLQLILKLQEYIDSPKCPFCGHDWENAENLSKQLENRLAQLSSIIHVLGHYAVEEEKDVKPALKRITELVLEHENLLKRKTQAERQIKRLMKDIESKSKKSHQLEEQKARFQQDIEGWQSRLARLKRKYPDLEFQVTPDGDQVSRLISDSQTNLDARKTSQEEDKKKSVALEKQIENIEKAQSDITKQITSYHEEETYCLQTLEQINKETAKKGLIDLMDQNVKTLTNSREELVGRVAAINQEIGETQTECEKIESQVSKTEDDLKKLQEERQSVEARYKELKKASETFKTDLQKKGISPARDLAEIISEIGDQKDKEILRPQKFERLQFLSQQLRSLLTLSQIQHELDTMEKAKTQKQRLLDRVAEDYRNLSIWAEQLKKLKHLAENKRREQEVGHFNMYSPIANIVYSRLNAHPFFNEIALEVRSGELKVLARLSKGQAAASHDINQVSPEQFFSEAQLNIAALSIFLATALHQKWSASSTIVIDDPVQNMDDFNVYAFLDLIRGLIVNGRQFILTTCNRDLYKLMLVKFRDLNKQGQNQFRAYRLKGIFPEGPEVIKDQ